MDALSQYQPDNTVNMAVLRKGIAQLEALGKVAPFTIIADPANIGTDVRELMDADGALEVDGKAVWVMDAKRARVGHRQGVAYYCLACGEASHPDNLSISGNCLACTAGGAK